LTNLPKCLVWGSDPQRHHDCPVESEPKVFANDCQGLAKNFLQHIFDPSSNEIALGSGAKAGPEP